MRSLRLKKTMPELPEVETIRRALEKRVVGLTIVECEVFRPDYIREGLNHLLQIRGAVIETIQRKGKQILRVSVKNA